MMILDEEKVMAMHEVISRETGGDPGLRDAALLESALGSAYQTFGGEDLFPTNEEKAAKLGFSLISNHAFVDGNKRIGMYVMLVFLEMNGVRIDPTNEDVVRVGLAVAAGEMKYDDLLGWIRSHRN